VSAQLEAGWQRRLEKARASLEKAEDVLEELELDPTLPYRGRYESQCQGALTEREFSELYLEGVRLAFDSHALAFYSFTDIVFSHVDREVELVTAFVQAHKEAEKRDKEEASV
jgi:hypothetical protein